MHRLVVLLVALAALASGCADSSSSSPPRAVTGDATLIATAQFGLVGLLNLPVASGRTLMRTTRDTTDVQTGYGGDFVQEMFGRASDTGAKQDWFWFVNGVLGAASASDYTLRPGDTGWWDYRPWGGQMDIFAAVGAWPDPFVHGFGGVRPRVSADAPLAAPLRAAGAQVVAGSSPWRVRVGSDAELREADPVYADAMRDPARAGAPGAIRGGAVELLPQGSGRLQAVPNARALAVALRTGNAPGDGVVLAVAGLDRTAALRAARTIAARPAVLRLRYAVAFDAAGQPLSVAGRGPSE